MSRGFHAFFRQYYNLRALLRRVDPALDGLVAADRLPAGPGRRARRLVRPDPAYAAAEPGRLRRPEPVVHACVIWPRSTSRRRWSCWTWTSRTPSPPTTGRARRQFLDRLRFPDGARHLALEVFARSFFAHPNEFSAGELVAMFHAYFLGSSEGLLFDVPGDDYDTALWAPLRRYLDGLGVEVRTGERVTAVEVAAGDRPGARWARGPRWRPPPWCWPPIRRPPATCCWSSGDRRSTTWRHRVAATADAPRRSRSGGSGWTGSVDAGRPPFLGTAGFGPLDNISVLERFEDGARRWSAQHGGSVVELHAYALVGAAGRVRSCSAQLRAELDRIYPELAGARGAGRGVAGRDDCPLAGTGPVGGPADRATRRTRGSCWPATASAATTRSP